VSDRKYRQRGYQDDPRDREPKAPKPRQQEPRSPGRQLQDASGPKTPNLMASHEVFRCARCGNRLGLPVETDSRCSRCGTDVHSCINCVSFDTSARWECSQPTLPARVSPKDERNACSFFAARTTVERQTSTAGPTSARQAFDDLFK
jgi:DNA-directed RNA polymerase subunit RPC12/RpoP